jgi:hypothetical protein
MIEVVAVPILVKAVDFLFDECRNILKERRTRTEQQDKNNAKFKDESLVSTGEKIISSGEEALRMSIEESIWKEMENEVKHLVEILEIQKKNYYLHMKQYEIYGDADVPQRIMHSVEKDEQGIADTGNKLQLALSKIYKAKISALEESDVD